MFPEVWSRGTLKLVALGAAMTINCLRSVTKLLYHGGKQPHQGAGREQL
jgi:hypothetical protein